MPQDQVSLFNIALAHIGDKSNGVSSPDDPSSQGKLCRLFYEPARLAVLRAFSWPCATKSKRLALSAEYTGGDWADDAPAPGYRFAYAKPADLVRPRYLQGFAGFIFEGGRFHTNQEQAVLRYTYDNTDISSWDGGLYDCVAYFLAARMNMQRSGKRQDTDYLLSLAKAQFDAEAALAANAESERYGNEVPAEIAARGYCGPAGAVGFIFPSETLSLVGGVNGAK